MKKRPLSHERIFDEKWAASYARRHAKWCRRIAKKYVKILTDRGFKDGIILDAGCGSGAILMEILKAFPDAKGIGVDLSEPILEIAKRDTVENGLANRVSFHKADVEELQLETGTFDLVISTNMLHIVENPMKMLNEIKRVLAPNGELILSDIKRSWLGYLMPILKSAYTPEEGVELMSRSNLRPWKISKGLIWWDVLASNTFRENAKG